MYGFLPFFEALAIISLVTGTGWCFLCAYHWRDIMLVQCGISVVLLLVMLEASFHYLYYLQLNKHGQV